MNEKTKRMRLHGAVASTGVLRDVFCFLAVGAMALSFVFAREEGTRAGYELSRLQSEHNELLREQKALKLEVATRRAPRFIEADARERLGMVDPSPDRILRIPYGIDLRDARAGR